MRPSIAVLWLCVGWLLACGGTSNERQCERFVRDFNDLACNPQKLDADAVCNADLDDGSCDMTAYFTCVGEQVRCEEDLLLADITACTPMCAP